MFYLQWYICMFYFIPLTNLGKSGNLASGRLLRLWRLIPTNSRGDLGNLRPFFGAFLPSLVFIESCGIDALIETAYSY